LHLSIPPDLFLKTGYLLPIHGINEIDRNPDPASPFFYQSFGVNDDNQENSKDEERKSNGSQGDGIHPGILVQVLPSLAKEISPHPN
jgi:hypothetical protein